MKMEYSQYLSEANKLKRAVLSGSRKTIKTALLRSFTIDQLEPIFKVQAFQNQFFIDLFLGGFNQFAREILDPASELYAFSPEVVILAVRLEEIYPALSDDYQSLFSKGAEVLRQVIAQMEEMITILKKRLNCIVLAHNFLAPSDNGCGLLDTQHPYGAVNLIRRINLALVESANKFSGVYLIDIENLAGKIGKKNIEDRKMWYLAGNPYKISFYELLAREYIKYLSAIYGFSKKCLVVDLDNTLWGGLAGEDGIAGIVLNDAYPGRCYKDFQRELLKLNKRGILLAVNSKNNFADALEIINRHPDMALREENFVCLKINWENKARNLRDIAAELNIGLDSMVFIDDSLAECELIRQKLPEVTVVHLPENPLRYVNLLKELNLFETLTITAESVRKTEMYKAELRRKQTEVKAESLDEYYRSLAMTVTIREVNEFLVPRMAELTQKTNQFNLTTKRYTQEEIKRLMRDPAYLLYAMQVADKFGDYGTVGLCIIEQINGGEWFIDTFLLSCRVMNRTVENAFMAFIFEKARANKVRRLVGVYLPTKKNAPVEHFFEQSGFLKETDRYIFNVNQGVLKYPEYINKSELKN